MNHYYSLLVKSIWLFLAPEICANFKPAMENCSWPTAAEVWELFDLGLIRESELADLLVELRATSGDTSRLQAFFPHLAVCNSKNSTPILKKLKSPLRLKAHSQADTSTPNLQSLALEVSPIPLGFKILFTDFSLPPYQRSLEFSPYFVLGNFSDHHRPLRYRRPPGEQLSSWSMGNFRDFNGFGATIFPLKHFSLDILGSLHSDGYFTLLGSKTQHTWGSFFIWRLRGSYSDSVFEEATGFAMQTRYSTVAAHLADNTGPRILLQLRNNSKTKNAERLDFWWSGKGKPSPFLRTTLKDYPHQWHLRSSTKNRFLQTWSFGQEIFLRSRQDSLFTASSTHSLRRQKSGAALEGSVGNSSWENDSWNFLYSIASGWDTSKNMGDSLFARLTFPTKKCKENKWSLQNGWKNAKTGSSIVSQLRDKQWILHFRSRWIQGGRTLTGNLEWVVRGTGSSRISVQGNWIW